MTSTPSLIIGHQSPNHLRALIAEIQRDDALAPVTVIAPSVYANLSLRHGFARGKFANVRFMPLARLAEYLGSPSLAAANRTPLTPALEGAAVRVASRRASGRLAGLASHPSTHRSLIRAFGELRLVDESALDALAKNGGLLAEVVRLYRDFRDLTEREYYHPEQLVDAATEAVERGNSAALSDLGFIVFFQIREVTRGQRALIEALAARGKCAVLLDLAGDDDADADTEALAKRLSHALGEPMRTDAPPPSDDDTRMLIAPDPHQEIRWAIRSIMRRAAGGVPFSRMAVLYRKYAPYSSLIGEELELAGIPIAGPRQTSLLDTAVGRTLDGLMKIGEGDLARGAVTAWLASCPLRRPPEDANERGWRGIDASRWDQISKEAGIVGGLEQWKSRLETHAENLETTAADALEQEEISEARAEGMRRAAQSARELRAFVSNLAERCEPPPDGSEWREFCDWAKELLNDYLSTNSMPESEEEARDKIEDALESLKTAQRIEPSPAFATFRRALDDALRAPVGHHGAVGEGVFVGSVRSAAAMRFDAAHVVGMIEGAMPPALRDDALLPERAKQNAGGAEAGFRMHRHQRASERYDYLSALRVAPSVALSYPDADPAAGRKHYPSRWFLERASEIYGKPLRSQESLTEIGEVGWLSVIPSAEAALDTVAEIGGADLYDYDLHSISSWKAAGHRVASHPLAKSGVLARTLELGRLRGGESFTEWDGNLSDIAKGSRFAAALTDRALSPTSLQSWAECPFRYFLGRILRLASVESPEDAHSISPLDSGSLTHRILERFMLDVQRDDRIPAPGEAWGAARREILMRVAQEEFDKAERRGVVGKPLTWALRKADIIADLDTFLEQDDELRRNSGVSPRYVEKRFGVEGGAWKEAALELPDGSEIRFRGIIDRVDVAPNGGGALALDYKTGDAQYYNGLEDDPSDRGRRLQVGAYALALRRALGDDAEVKAAYWFVSDRGKFEFRPKNGFDAGDENARERFAAAVSAIADGIRGGVFPANSGKREEWRGGFENCKFCEFDRLCPSRRDKHWENKRDGGDKRLAGYLELAEGAPQ